MKKLIISIACISFFTAGFCQSKKKSILTPIMNKDTSVQIRYFANLSADDINQLWMFVVNVDLYSDKGKQTWMTEWFKKFKAVKIPTVPDTSRKK